MLGLKLNHVNKRVHRCSPAVTFGVYKPLNKWQTKKKRRKKSATNKWHQYFVAKLLKYFNPTSREYRISDHSISSVSIVSRAVLLYLIYFNQYAIQCRIFHHARTQHYREYWSYEIQTVLLNIDLIYAMGNYLVELMLNQYQVIICYHILPEPPWLEWCSDLWLYR